MGSSCARRLSHDAENLGWWQYKRGKPVPLLMEAYGHTTQKQTLEYLCIQAEDVAELYDLEL